MAVNSAIEWTESTWNPVTGCSKISEGCFNCYAERMSKRLRAMGQPNYKYGFKPATHPQALELPLRWKKPQMIFVNSMSDLFHEDVPADFILRVFSVMETAYWHKFQILTKRPERLLALNDKLRWAANILMGVTVENGKYLRRIDDLRKTGAATKFLSLEPLLGPLDGLDLSGVDWVIVGGESGPGARYMSPDWVEAILALCKKQNVPFFFKQWGGIRKKEAGRVLKGQTWDEMPELTAV